MDSLTHVYFAWRLAEVSGTDPGSAYAALFPQIDRNPPYFHRLYAHNFALARELSRIGQEVMATGKIPPRFKDNYAWKRFLEERPRIVAYREKFAQAAGVSLPAPGRDALSGAIAYLSHIYFDTYNNPVQAFLPEIAYALIAQTARSCFVKVPPRVVASTYNAIGIGEPPDSRELREATDFIREKEDLTIRLTLEYGRMKPRLKRSDRPPLPV